MLRRQSSELGNYSIVSLIPARGGSKGIPRKNLRVVAGKSLLQRAIETCRASELASDCYVSTEDLEIATQAITCGANLIARDATFATDEATSCDVLLSALGKIHPMPDTLAFVQCTSPLLRPEEIDGCIRRLVETGAEVAVAAVPFHGMVCTESFGQHVAGVNWNLWEPRRRQDMRRQWVIAGSVWAFDVRAFLCRQTIYSPDTVLYEVPSSLDIDDERDLATAEKLLSPPPVTMRAIPQEIYYPH
jgi:CMP-N-acetylneuraminic acid synthetase